MNFSPPNTKETGVSSKGFWKPFRKLGRKPIASIRVTRITDTVGSLVSHQRRIEIKATTRAIQSNRGNLFHPRKKAKTQTLTHASVVMPVTHAPAPPF